MIKYLSNVQDMSQSHYKLFCDFYEKDSDHFLKIKNDIFDICKCTIFYDDKENKELYKTDYDFDVSKVNLYVLIVSSSVLFDSGFDRRRFDAAIEAKIPVLPIMVENGLEAIFNEKFANIQCINACIENVDFTAIPYLEKIRLFLTQALSLAYDFGKLRKSFDATIFLSYRKKDRKYTQKLFDIIHSSDELKNIAIWYDEFLVPGEDFNDSIKSELQNSAIFILMVTPSILEEENYIKIVEYPIAKSLHKTIVPIEAVKTNADEVKSNYPALPEIISSSETDRIKDIIKKLLAENGIVISEKTPERDFFIGLAFLKGIYVEKNADIAMKMISSAAMEGVSDAIPALVSMYKYGDGCAIDTENAALWQKKYIDQRKFDFENSSTKENAENVIAAYKELADIYVCGKNTDAAAASFMEIVRFMSASVFVNENFAKIHIAEAYESAALLLIKTGNYSENCYSYIEKAIGIRREIYMSDTVENSVVDLIYAYILLAKCQYESDNIIGLKTTIKVNLKELKEKLLEYRGSGVPSNSLQTLKKVLFNLSSIGEYYNRLDMEEQAFVFIGAAANLSEAINKYYNDSSTNIIAYNTFKNDGEQHIGINVENHLNAAELAFSKAHDVALKLIDRSKTVEIRMIVAESYLNLARVRHRLKNEEDTVEYLKTALRLYSEISEDIHTIPLKQQLYKCYYMASEIYTDLKLTEKAYSLLDKGLEINSAIIMETPLSIYKLEMAEALKTKGEMLKKQWEFDEALECFEKRHNLVLNAFYKNAHVLLVAESYTTLIAAHKSVGNIQEANELTMQLNAFKSKYDYFFNGNVTLYKS